MSSGGRGDKPSENLRKTGSMEETEEALSYAKGIKEGNEEAAGQGEQEEAMEEQYPVGGSRVEVNECRW